MIAGIIVALYFEITLRWGGGIHSATFFDHLVMSAPQVFCLVIGAVYQWGAVRNKYDWEMMPEWFCRLLCLYPLFFLIGNAILFTWLFLLGGIDHI